MEYTYTVQLEQKHFPPSVPHITRLLVQFFGQRFPTFETEKEHLHEMKNQKMTRFGHLEGSHIEMTHSKEPATVVVDESEYYEVQSFGFPVSVYGQGMNWIWGDTLTLSIQSDDRELFHSIISWLVAVLIQAGVSENVLPDAN